MISIRHTGRGWCFWHPVDSGQGWLLNIPHFQRQPKKKDPAPVEAETESPAQDMPKAPTTWIRISSSCGAFLPLPPGLRSSTSSSLLRMPSVPRARLTTLTPSLQVDGSAPSPHSASLFTRTGAPASLHSAVDKAAGPIPKDPTETVVRQTRSRSATKLTTHCAPWDCRSKQGEHGWSDWWVGRALQCMEQQGNMEDEI